MAKTFTLSGGSPTVSVNAYASSSSGNSSVTITVTAQGALAYSGSYVQDSGVTAVFSCTGQSSSGHKTLFGRGTYFSSTTYQNQTYTFTVPKSTSSQTVTWTVNFYSWWDSSNMYSDAKATFSGTVTVGALTSYTVSYNANGGSGAPSSQTKYYGKTLTLSTTTPTRTGYKFSGWATSSTSTTVAYKAGGSYTANAAATLYAVWVAETPFVITYDANGGSGAPSSQNKTVGVAITLSTTKPTRTNYRFAGWSTNSAATFAPYAAGATFTIDADVTLYAVWHTSIYDSYDLLIPTSSDMQDLWFEIGNNTEISDLYYRIS